MAYEELLSDAASMDPAKKGRALGKLETSALVIVELLSDRDEKVYEIFDSCQYFLDDNFYFEFVRLLFGMDYMLLMFSLFSQNFPHERNIHRKN